jgi:hypothetical protein
MKYQISSNSIQWEQYCPLLKDGQADGWTNMTELIVAFCSFVGALKNQHSDIAHSHLCRLKK